MAIHIDWHNHERSIIHWTFEGRFTVLQLHRAFDRSHEMMASVKNEVDHIVDLTQAYAAPNGFISAMRARHRESPANYRISFVVTRSGYWRSLVLLAETTAATRGRYHVAETVQEATQWLWRWRKNRNT